MNSSQETKQDEGEASSKHKKKLYLMGIPRRRNIVTSITMDHIGKPRFWTEPVDDSAIGRLSTQYAERWSKNTSRLLSAIKGSLRYVPLSSDVCEMRVILGSFVFDSYCRPNNPRAGYSISEFDGMLDHESSRGHMGMSGTLLLDRISKASDLFDLMRASTIHHAVEIEFLSEGGKSFHLEADFNSSGGHYELLKSRWVVVESSIAKSFARNTQKRPLLQAVMLNPEKADWELRIRERTIVDPNQIPDHMRQVPCLIRLRDGVVEETLSTQREQRTTIPSGLAVHRLIEKATMRFPVKGTDYVLEVSRYDIYYSLETPKPARKGRVISNSPMRFTHKFSYWGAEVVSRGWDQDMMNFSRMKPEQNMNIDAVVNQLFPRRPGETQSVAFERLIKVVMDVAGLWDQTDSHYTELMPTTSADLETHVNFTRGAIEGVLIELD